MSFRGWQSRACRSAIIVSCSAIGVAVASCFSVLVGVGLAKIWSEPVAVADNAATPVTSANSGYRYSKVLYETDFLRDLANGRAFKRV